MKKKNLYSAKNGNQRDTAGLGKSLIEQSDDLKK